MKTIIRKIGLFILGCFIVIFPFLTFMLVANNQPHVYSKTYYAALVDKVNLLKETKKDKKIILIGGSNVAFGFNSELLEKEFTDYKVVNFGLYGMLGTKIMMDLAKDYIGKGDLVFVIPETENQSMSLYFNASSTLKALEDDTNLIYSLDKSNQEMVFGEYFSFVSERAKYKGLIDPGETVYRRDIFNKYGDVEYLSHDSNESLRASNIMGGKHYISPMIDLESISFDNDFFDYLNSYNEVVTAKGGTLYYSFCPINDLSVMNDDEDILNSFYCNIRQRIGFKCVGYPGDYVIDSHYFYDTNFHLNDSGAIYRTFVFATDLYRDVFVQSKRPSFDIPPEPDYSSSEDVLDEDSETAYLFEYEQNGNEYSIVHFKEAYNAESVELPSVFNHSYVTSVNKKAFVLSTSLKEITVPESYRSFENLAFDDCLSLNKIYLKQKNPSMLFVDYTGGLFNNISGDLRVYVPKESLDSYKTDYNWSTYSKYLLGY